jgi:hypothetical protein
MMPPASNAPTRSNAWRRGISLATMRAASSKK